MNEITYPSEQRNGYLVSYRFGKREQVIMRSWAPPRLNLCYQTTFTFNYLPTILVSTSRLQGKGNFMYSDSKLTWAIPKLCLYFVQKKCSSEEMNPAQLLLVPSLDQSWLWYLSLEQLSSSSLYGKTAHSFSSVTNRISEQTVVVSFY